MAGVGRTPKENRQNPRDIPKRGDWTSLEGIGWQHGETPKPPTGLLKASKDTWETWMGAWFAAFWTPEDLPALRQLIRLYDQVERGKFQRAAEMRIQMDAYGITPKGQQDRRWKRPAETKEEAAANQQTSGLYGHLRAVND